MTTVEEDRFRYLGLPVAVEPYAVVDCEVYCEECADAYGAGAERIGPQEELLADTPWHCAGCGVLFSYDLTEDGLDYVLVALTERGESDWALQGGAAVSRWAEHYGSELKEHVGSHLYDWAGPLADAIGRAMQSGESGALERAKLLLELLED